MTKTSTRLIALVMALVLLLSLVVMAMTVTVSAVSNPNGNAYEELLQILYSGSYTYVSGNRTYNYTQNRYQLQGGGYVTYVSLWDNTALTALISGQDNYSYFTDSFERLTAGAKQDFLQNVFTIANAVADDTVKLGRTGTGQPTDSTVSDFMTAIQTQSGMGSAMLATLLQNTKPNYVAANRIYEPFSGVVGTILGIVSVLLMAALGVTMALDIAYITIPAFQMALGGTNEGGHGDKSKGIGGIISQEAKKAVQAADGGQGGQAGSGEYKAAVGIYFKYRWKGLVLLGLCLLYLVQGQIYSFVAWFIDLFSGFLGF